MDLAIRRAGPDELDAVVSLAGTALGWPPGEPHAELFRWKHRQNPFGASPMWVATEGDDLVGFRTFLRWEFERPDGEVVRAVRAVDTATHPDHQGKGIFTRLTTAALAELAEDGTAFVFNTPNDQSRPGYLKMGWQVVGDVPVGVRMGGLASGARMARARTPAGKWSVATRVGLAAADALGDAQRTEGWLRRADRPLVAGWPRAAGTAASGPLATRRTGDLLRWRYALAPLGYRVLPVTDDPADGFAAFRLRGRGAALEATLCDVLLPEGTGQVAAAALVGRLRRATRADYVIGVRTGGVDGGLAPLPGQGPTLTWRALQGQSGPGPDLADWRFCLGDIELF